MTKAVFDGVVLAESSDVKVVEGMTYFPIENVDMSRLTESPKTSRCLWKGKANYWHVEGQSDINANAAFAYANPWPLARRLVADRVAFWQGVQIIND